MTGSRTQCFFVSGNAVQCTASGTRLTRPECCYANEHVNNLSIRLIRMRLARADELNSSAAPFLLVNFNLIA